VAAREVVTKMEGAMANREPQTAINVESHIQTVLQNAHLETLIDIRQLSAQITGAMKEIESWKSKRRFLYDRLTSIEKFSEQPGLSFEIRSLSEVLNDA